MSSKPADPTTADVKADMATYEELAALEQTFDEVDNVIIARQYKLSKPLYTQRSSLIKKIDNFWTIALEQAPEEIDQYIMPSDSELFAACLKDIDLDRFDIPETIPDSSNNVDDYGQPRSFKLTFEFSENDWFSDASITKTFWYRHSKHGLATLVSEPVKINWKKGKDLTRGLLDASCNLFEAQKKAGKGTKAKSLPEFEQLQKKIRTSTGGAQSFFTFFGYRGPWISEEESREATKKMREDKGKYDPDADMEEASPDMDSDGEDEESEIFPGGAELATVLAEDFYTGAIKYFTEAQEADLMSDDDFEDVDGEDDGDDDEEVPNLVELVNGGKGKGAADTAAGQPPKKKRKA